jgi:hypothetical protein
MIMGLALYSKKKQNKEAGRKRKKKEKEKINSIKTLVLVCMISKLY